MQTHPFADYLRDRGMPTGFLDCVPWHTVTPVSPKTDTDALCYVIQAGNGGPIKIGVAISPTARLKDLQVANPVPLTILKTYPGGYETEATLHTLASSHAIRGEWFHAAALDLLP